MRERRAGCNAPVRDRGAEATHGRLLRAGLRLREVFRDTPPYPNPRPPPLCQGFGALTRLQHAFAHPFIGEESEIGTEVNLRALLMRPLVCTGILVAIPVNQELSFTALEALRAPSTSPTIAC